MTITQAYKVQKKRKSTKN